MWHRVFGQNDAHPQPNDLLEHLHSQGCPVQGHFRGDDQGWFAADLIYAAKAAPLTLERYLAGEEGIRAELNTWAAWLETADYSPNHQKLMEQVIQTTQLFTLRKPIDCPDEILADKICECLCKYLANATAGFFQIDSKGFFAADGSLLLQEY